MSVYQRLGFGLYERILAFISGLKKQPYARSAPSIPPPFLPRQSPGAKGGQAVESVRREALGIRGTAKEPYASWYVPRLVDDPGSISRARLFLESMVIPIAHNRFTYPTHQRS
jgi:hypothetical protein